MAPEDVVKKLLKEKYPLASCAFLAGSIMRKGASKYSDLDIVVLYDHLDPAFRESFIFMEYPIDTFHHDYQTLKYFFEEIDTPSAYLPLIHMIIEGEVYPSSNELSEKAKAFALTTIESGPKPYTQQEIAMQRYRLTSLVDDIRDYRSTEELQGTLQSYTVPWQISIALRKTDGVRKINPSLKY
jgi:predicted nucleotidyltransferase